jgi:uncharacterized hydrophobic protein (TIGR00271 family)
MTQDQSGVEAGDVGNPSDARPVHTGDALTPWGSILQRIRAPEPWTEAERQEVLDELFFDGAEWIPYLKRFFALIVLSTAIAAFGLIADSSAVVIGAMLVAPLMTPMLAVSTAVIYGRLDRIVASGIVIVLGTIAAIAVGALVATVAFGSLAATDLPGQILARTNPSLLDLGIAITAGMAAGYVLAHRKAGASLPGVAIAVALVPPLATVGITWRVGATVEAQGALLLYLTNLVAIVLSAGVVMLVSGFVPRHIRALAKGHLTVGFAISLVALLAITVPLAIHTVDQLEGEQVSRVVGEVVPDWDEAATIERLSILTGSDAATITVEVATTGEPQPAWELAERIAAESGLDVDLTVNYRAEIVDEASTR